MLIGCQTHTRSLRSEFKYAGAPYDSMITRRHFGIFINIYTMRCAAASIMCYMFCTAVAARIAFV